MNDLKTIVNEQEIQAPQSTLKYKIAAVICVFLVLYGAYCCVHLNFKVLTFMNEIAEIVLSFLNRIILYVSTFLREMLDIIAG